MMRLGVMLSVISVGVAMVAPANAGDDPNIAPYPGRYDVARMKGSPPNEEPVPLDVTGTWDQQVQIDAIGEVLARGPVPDGGLSWDADTRMVVVRLVGPVDGSSPEVERLKASVLALAEGFTVRFESVKYSRAELEQLASRLFGTMSKWGPSDHGIGGGWDCYANRVLVQIVLGTPETRAWIDAVRALEDDRILVQTFTPVPGVGGPE
jgi:hypothetical protein